MSIDLDHRGLIRVYREHCISEIIFLLVLINVNIFPSFISFGTGSSDISTKGF